MKLTIQYQDLGSITYKDALVIQEQHFNNNLDIKLQNRKNPDSGQNTLNHLFFCEHKHVITLGKSGKKDNLLLSEDYMKQRGIEFFYTNRGGDITYHGPGQIVGYPILDLEQFNLDIHTYIYNLEQVIIELLKEFNLVAGRLEGMTGVWLDWDNSRARKICAIGVKASRYVTMHGFAFNVNTNLDYFKTIVPCGIQGKEVTSLQKELNKPLNLDIIKEKTINYFQKVFNAEIRMT